MLENKKKKERIFNLPNLITLIRLLMIPAFLYFFFYWPDFPVWSLLLLAFFTDFLDGQIARRLNEVTRFGVVFDPLVDRLFIFSVLVAYYFQGYLPLIFVLPVWLRDFLIIVGYLFLKTRKVSLDVSLLGKIATFLIFSSLVMTVFPGAERLGLYIYVLGALFYLYSGFDYFIAARTVWKKESVPKTTKFFKVKEVK